MTLTKKKSSPAVPGTVAGFVYQFGRAFRWLATNRGDFRVGIETLDDVVFEEVTGTTSVEQDKHSIKNAGQPITDRSEALWKTLGNWASMLEERPKDYRFIFVTNRPVPKTSLVSRISQAKKEDEVEAAVDALLKAAKDPSGEIEEYCDTFRKLDRQKLRDLVSRITLSSSVDWDSLRQECSQGLQLPTSLLAHEANILDEILGWLADVSMKAWMANKPSVITSQEFANALDSAKERSRRDRTRERPALKIPITADDLAGIVNAIFVQQLDLLDVGDESVQDAINDFIRYGKEVIRLTQSGEFTPPDWDVFEEELQSRWKRIFHRNERLHGKEDEKRCGFRTYHDTTTNFLAPLKGEPTDHVYFTSGAYHRLADEEEVGWHPRFIELLAGGDS